MLRIGVIGPVEPFRSGVARHTSALARAFSRRPSTAVRVFSFARQYPGLLFPGKSDRMDPPRMPPDLDVKYVIDSINPITWRRTAREVQDFRCELVIAPAWTFFVAPAIAYLLGHAMRQGVSVVSVVHNVADHEAASWKRRLIAHQIRKATTWITHTEHLGAEIRGLVPTSNVQVRAHPTFDYPTPLGTFPRRADLELLMFGLIRPYKGLDVLLEALSLVTKRSVMLSVVGEAWQDMTEIQSLIDRLHLREHVEIVPRHVSDEEAAEYFSRADAVVLPYRSVTGSGVLPLAFHYGKPVLASRLAGLAELIEEGRTGWTVTPEQPDELARTIDERVCRESAMAMAADIQRVRAQLSFDRFAEVVLETARVRQIQ